MVISDITSRKVSEGNNRRPYSQVRCGNFTLLIIFLFISSACFAHEKHAADIMMNMTDRLGTIINNCKPNSAELYTMLRSLHQEATEKGIPLVYPKEDINQSGKIIRLTISNEQVDQNNRFLFIPLPNYTDFNGWTIEINQQAKIPVYLFHFSESHEQRITQNVSKRKIDAGRFTSIDKLNDGTKLLIIEDRTPWTYRNETPDTYFPDGQPGTPWQKWDRHDPKYRRDILLLDNGIAQNTVIAPYNTKASKPSCSFVTVTMHKKEIKNLRFIRKESSGDIAKLLYITNSNNVTVSNITVETEPSQKSKDACITIINSANISIENYTIQRTYSSPKAYGYGIDMNNVWNVHISKIKASGPEWGVFGNNNLNTVRLDSCTINRMDLHMYGKDISCSHCTFRNDNYKAEIAQAMNRLDTYQERHTHVCNRYAALYGTLTYDSCHFDGFVPFLTDYGYNIFAKCDVEFRNCTMDIFQKKYAYLFLMGYWGAQKNERPENAMRHWNNVLIDNMTIRLHANIPNVYLFYFLDREMQRVPIKTQLISNTPQIKIQNLRMTDSSGRLLNNNILKRTNTDSHEYTH